MKLGQRLQTKTKAKWNLLEGRLIELAEAGKTLAEIADELGETTAAVRGALDYRDIRLRTVRHKAQE